MAAQPLSLHRLPLRSATKPTPLAGSISAGLGLCVAYLFVGGLTQEAIYHLLGVAPSAAIVVGVHRYRPTRRFAWYVLAVGSACGALGDFLWFGYGWFGDVTPFPGPSDFAYFAGDLLIVVGFAMVVLQRGHTKRELLDASIVAVAGGVVLWDVLIGPALGSHGSVLAVALAAGSPALDAALLAVLMPLVLARTRNTTIRLLVAYAAITVLGDTVYGIESLHNGYVSGSLLDLTWLLGFVFLGAAACSPALRHVADSMPRRRWDDRGRLLLLGTSLITVFGALATLDPSWHAKYIGVCLGTLLSIVLVFLRIGFLHSEQRVAAVRLRRESERLAAVEAVQRDLAAGLELRAFLQSVCEHLHGLVGAGVVISLLDGDDLIVGAFDGKSGVSVGETLPPATFAAHALAADRILISDDAAKDPRADARLVAKSGASSLIAAPLHFAGTPIGAVTVVSQHTGAFSPRDARTVSLMASLISVAVNRDAEFAATRALADVVDSSADAVIREDTDGVIISWNKGAEQLFGFAAAEMVGRSIEEIIPGDLRAQKNGNFDLLKAGELVAPYETERIAKDGHRIPVTLGLTPVRDAQGRVVAVTGIARDLSETHALQDQLYQAQKMEAVGRLAGGVAHDFNNLLMAIQGYGSLLLGLVEDNPTERRYAEQIVEASKRSAELTQQLLAYSRKQVLQPGIINPNMVVEEIERLLARMVGEDVVVMSALDPEVGDVLVDRSRLGQVVMNLAVNARDAMPHGGQLTISTAAVELHGLEGEATGGAPAGRYARVAVTDTGVGIEPDIVEQIFEPFFTTKGERGTGLGLATVFGTVTQSGGYVGLRTAPGEGATFSVYLPECHEHAASEPLLVAAA
ncbi:MAG TPA: PAS domain S-box protein [Gaiellaceae bacterium]|jgi:PAS domain S-box-containing protein